jgi:hypothetical protein
MVSNSTNINKNHLAPQLIEWWSTFPPISTKITWGERWFWLILVELLTIIQWVEVRGDFGWYWWNCWPSLNELNRWVIHLSLQLIEWWSTIPPISTKVTSHLNSLSDGQQFHQYQQKSPLTITQVIFVDIGGIVDHHSMYWGDRWFLLMLVELLTLTQWVEVRGDFCWYWWNCWPSLNELRW